MSIIGILAVAIVTNAQGTVARRLLSGTAVPTANCTPGPPYADVYFRTTTGELYICTSTNTWTAKTATGAPGTLTGSSATWPLAVANPTTTPAISFSITCTDAGSTDAYVCTPSPAVASYTNSFLIFTPNTSNTGAATINANALGVKNIKKLVGASVSDPADGDLRVGGRYLIAYDGTQFLILSTLGNTSAGVASINGDTTAAQVITATDASVVKTDAGATHSFGLPYTLYVASLTQSSTGAPVATVQTNTTGATFTWGRTSTGAYTATASSAVMTTNKTTVLMSPGGGGTAINLISYVKTSTTALAIKTWNGFLGDFGDSLLNETTIEIRIYP